MSKLSDKALKILGKIAPKPGEVAEHQTTLPWGNPVSTDVMIYHNPEPNRELHIRFSYPTNGFPDLYPDGTILVNSNYYIKINSHCTSAELLEAQQVCDIDTNLLKGSRLYDFDIMRVMIRATAASPRNYDAPFFIKDKPPKPTGRGMALDARKAELFDFECSRLTDLLIKLDWTISQSRGR